MEVNMNPDIIEEMAALAAAIKAKTEDVEESSETLELSEEHQDNEFLQKLVATVNGRLSTLEKKNKETESKLAEAEYKAEASRRVEVLKTIGLPEDHVNVQLATCFNMNQEQFDDYIASLAKLLNDIITGAKASIQEQKTLEGGDSAEATSEEVVKVIDQQVSEETTEIESEEAAAPEASVEVETKEAVDETGSAEEEQVVDTTSEVEDQGEDIEVDIEAVDPALNIETDNNQEEKSLTDKMAEIAAVFLKHNNPKWVDLVQKK
jgi:hypothetical protein